MSAPETTPEGLAVTQADRDFASEIVIAPENARQIKAGDWDHHIMVQRAARHRLAATPTALPSAEDALREASIKAAIQIGWPTRDFTADPVQETEREYWQKVAAALQSPRASDEVLGEAGGACDCAARFYGDDPNAHQLCCAALSASPVPVDASGVERERILDAMLQARNMVPGIRWDDGMTEGIARIEKMLMERVLDVAAPMIAALSHTAPVADAQAGEGGE